MHRHQPPRIASWACAISEVKFPVASSTKIQIEILIPSNCRCSTTELGPDDRRVLAPIEFSGHRQLQTADVPRSAFELEGEDRWQARRIGPHRASRIRTVTSSLEAFTTGFNLPLLYALSFGGDGSKRLHLRPLSRYPYSLLHA
jgi:hypothetical protein